MIKSLLRFLESRESRERRDRIETSRLREVEIKGLEERVVQSFEAGDSSLAEQLLDQFMAEEIPISSTRILRKSMGKLSAQATRTLLSTYERKRVTITSDPSLVNEAVESDNMELTRWLVCRFIEPYLLAMPCVMLPAWLENRFVPNWC